jgi:selenide,water dikinase
VIIVGGHTVDDQEPKFGMAVTGLVEPGREVTNAGAKPGDSLVLTKPIGTGVITTAAKQDHASPEVLAGAVECMGQLNRDAAHAMVEVGANACVDVTGFGLIGHLLEIARASGVSAEVSLGAVPLLDGVRDLLAQGIAPGGTRRNLASADRDVDWDPALDENDRLLLCDAQTSGGLLISVEAGRTGRLVEALEAHGASAAAVVGRVLDGEAFGGAAIRVIP